MNHLIRKCLAVITLCLLITPQLVAQKKSAKYQSLLWEITGNGLKKPSYLFGTMHISNKLVFHLSDSFYNAIQNADMVAIEVDPDLMQSELPEISEESKQYQAFYNGYYSHYITQKTFTTPAFEPTLKRVLMREPHLNNNLLYRSVYGMDNFEENTYLDLYIYQTGRKLGKQFGGVENFWESERLSVEASSDMRKEQKKNKKTRDYSDVSGYDIGQGLQDAYRKGDLDVLDSLNMISMESPAYLEKFLYRRNENMAYAMDSIMKTKTLFTGVGAAHLPGKRGVIELLRKKGYKLRQISMKDHDAKQKEAIDSVKVPVHFMTQYSSDSSFTVRVPGKLFDMHEDKYEASNYADMANGSYYLVTRIKTNRLFTGYDEAKALKTVDSMMYESIPGKILSKTSISKNGYKGYNVVNKTRRGDIQRYQIFATPYEILVFKMSGTEGYVDGPEADSFFNSISIKQPVAAAWHTFQPASGGFEVSLPVKPDYWHNESVEEKDPRAEYEAIDPQTGDVFSVIKRMNYNTSYMDEDSFSVGLAAESFYTNTNIKKQTDRKAIVYEKHAGVDATGTTEDNEVIRTRFLVSGPEFYLLAVRTKDKNKDFSSFFNSFHLRPYVYGKPVLYVDSFLHFSVKTPVKPELSDNMSKLISYSYGYMQRYNDDDDKYHSDAETQTANFIDPNTGQTIYLSTHKYPKYYYNKDSADFTTTMIGYATRDSDLRVINKKETTLSDNSRAYSFYLADTNTTQVIRKLMFFRGNIIYVLTTMRDSLTKPSEFEEVFYSSVLPYKQPAHPTLFETRTDKFFKDYYSSDTNTRKVAIDDLSTVYFGPKGYPKIMTALRKLKAKDPDYFELKSKFIRELGYLHDSTVNKSVVNSLDTIYHNIGDTSMFQNAVLRSLARLKTKEATQKLKELLLQDPPAFESNDDYESLLSSYNDSLELAVALYPELLKLSSIDGFKEPVISLLASIKEKKLIQPEVYESYNSSMFFDAKLALKKQNQEDERQLQNEMSTDNNEYSYSSYNSNNSRGILDDYAILLIPFYDKNPGLPAFYNKLLHSKNSTLKLNTALVLTENNKPVADTIWTQLGKDNRFRAGMYQALTEKKKLNFFPAKYKTQLAMAKAELYANTSGSRIDSLQLISKQVVQFKQKKGYVYVYKYKMKNSDDWKIATSGLQPENLQDCNDNDDLVDLTQTKLKKNKPEAEQVEKELHKVLVTRHRAGSNFYSTDRDYGYYRDNYDGGD